MSGSSRSRQKPKLEPISLEELAGTTGMSGFGTLFTRDLSQSVPVLDRLEEASAPETSAADPTAPEISAPVFETSALAEAAVRSTAVETSAPVSDVPSAPEGGALEASALETPAIVPAAVEANAPVFSVSTAPGTSVLETSALGVLYRRPRIRRADTVAEGHSLAEQAIYELMYREGKPYQGEHRILTTGLRTLAERARMAYANCKANVRSLIGKLALEEYGEGFSYTVGRTYIIYSAQEVMRRRRAAGLTHVIRTRGVAFVDPESGTPIECTRYERG